MREREYVSVPIELDRPIVNDQFEFIDILQRCMALITLLHFLTNQFGQMQ